MSTASGPHDTREPLALRVAILTYKRPGQLATILADITSHVLAVERDARWDATVDVLVVDNDAAASARDHIPTEGELHVSYVVEPQPGIASARDRAIQESPDVDVLVFVDDDEIPTDQWLLPMVALWFERRPAAVAGRVLPRYEVEPSPFILAGGFFDRQTHPTGIQVHAAATNNLLLDLHQVRALGVRFDRTLGLLGGSDTLFTSTLTKAGGVILWCHESAVIDIVPADRSTTRWVLHRRYSHGTTTADVAVRLADPGTERLAVRAREAAAGAALVVNGLSRAGYGAVRRSVPHEARGMRAAARGAGRFLGAFGYRYVEYKRKPQ